MNYTIKSAEKTTPPPSTPYDPLDPDQTPESIPLPPDSNPQPREPVREPGQPEPIKDPDPPQPTRLV